MNRVVSFENLHALEMWTVTAVLHVTDADSEGVVERGKMEKSPSGVTVRVGGWEAQFDFARRAVEVAEKSSELLPVSLRWRG